MSLETCAEHDDAIVVYERNGYNRAAPCPLCDAITTADDLAQVVEDIEAERDGLKDTVADLKSEVQSLNLQISDLEYGDDQ
jgi:hypothetical protein